MSSSYVKIVVDGWVEDIRVNVSGVEAFIARVRERTGKEPQILEATMQEYKEFHWPQANR